FAHIFSLVSMRPDPNDLGTVSRPPEPDQLIRTSRRSDFLQLGSVKTSGFLSAGKCQDV
ncbi:hypothetical protein BgiMline_015678, partial [Biomphalaria glabrata]